MKRYAILLIIACVVAGLGFGQTGDARTMAMGNAMTSLADDVNAMYFNPAGIGFLNKGYLVVGATAGVGVTNRAVFGAGRDELPYPSEHWDTNGNIDYYTYEDPFLKRQVFFDPAPYGPGFPWNPNVENSYETQVELYKQYRDAYSTYQTLQSLYNIGGTPRVAFQGTLFGLSTIYDITTDITLGEYDEGNTDVNITVHRNQGAMAAIGFKLGFIGIGANFKYIQTVDDPLPTIKLSDFADGNMPVDLPTQLVSGSENQSVPVSHFELGLGTLAAIGPLNIGAYIDNLLFFIDPANQTVDIGDLFNTMSVGVSFTPFDIKTQKKHGILNLIGSVDLKNFGSQTDRQLAAGAEVGLNLGDVIVFNVRGGYVQPLPGTLAEMVNNFDPNIGMYSIGVGAKFLIVSMDLAAIMPADIALHPPTAGTINEDRLSSPFAQVVFNTSISF